MNRVEKVRLCYWIRHCGVYLAFLLGLPLCAVLGDLYAPKVKVTGIIISIEETDEDEK